MKQKTARKIGFFSALSICFTSIVGIGIFLKNAAVGKNVEGNGISWLITWIIVGLLAISLAYHFGHISKIESKNGVTGLNLWVNNLTDNKTIWFKKIASTNYGLFYNPILTICLTFFTTEFLIEFFKTINPSINLDMWAYVLITLLLLAFFVINNYFSKKLSSFISLLTSFLKFIPLFLVIIIGIVFYKNHNLPNTENGFDISISFDKALQGIMLSVPGVLFAFDSFIGVATWSKDIKGGEKSVSKVIVISMTLITIIYCLISLSSIFHFNKEGTTIANVLLDSLPLNARNAITMFISLFIFISAFGTSNSVCGISINEFRNIIISKKFYFLKMFNNVRSQNRKTLCLSTFIFTIWFLILIIPTIIINNDCLIDGFSNLVVIYMFLIYIFIIYLFWKKVYKNQTTAQRKKSFPKIYSFLVWFSIISIFIVSFLNIFFVFYEGIKSWNQNSNWGLFLNNQNGFTSIENIYVMIIYVIFSIFYFSIPFILLNKKNSKKF